MGFYQLIEVCIVGILFCIQIYVCFLVVKLAMRISTFLPNKSNIILTTNDVHSESNNQKLSNKDEIIQPSGKVIKVSYHYIANINRRLNGIDALFNESTNCSFTKAVVKLSEYENGMSDYVSFGSVTKIQFACSAQGFYDTFEVKHNIDSPTDYPEVLQKGICKKNGRGWIIVQKCIISYN